MSFEYECSIYPDIGLVVERYRGQLEVNQLLESLERMQADPNFDVNFDRLIDVMEADTLEGLEGLDRFMAWLDENEPGSEGKRAVASGDPRLVAMAHQISLSEVVRREVKSFPSVPDALAWLGIEYGSGDQFVRSDR